MNPDKSVLENVTYSHHEVIQVTDSQSLQVKDVVVRASRVYQKCQEYDEFFDVESVSDADWEIAERSQENPKASDGWFKKLSAVAADTGSSLLNAVKIATPQIVQDAASIGAAYVTFTVGELAGVAAYAKNGNFAVDMAQAAAGVLPDAGIYKDKISKSQETLNAITESTACSEMCKATSGFVTNFLDFYLVHADEIETKELRLEAFEEYLFVSDAENSSTLSTFGKVIKAAVNDHKELIQETVELNLLNVCTNLMTVLKKLQDDNPYILVDIIMMALDETEQALALQKSDDHSQNEEVKSELFSKNLAKLLLRYALPTGYSGLEIPFMPRLLAPFIYSLLENKLVPSLLSMAYDTAMSEKSRDLLFLKGCEMVQDYFKSTTFSTEEKEASKKLPGYSGQHKFNEKLGSLVYEFVESIDSKLFHFFSLFGNAKQRLSAYGPQVTEAISKVNLVAVATAAADAGRQLVQDAPQFIKTENEKIAHEEEEEKAALDRGEAVFKAMDATVLATEEYVLKKISPQLSSKFSSHILRHLELFRTAIATCFAKLIFILGGEKKIKTATELLHNAVHKKPIAVHALQQKIVKIELP